MSIANISAYIESRNGSSRDYFADWVADGLCFSNTEARMLLNYLQLGDDTNAAAIIRDKLEEQYGDKAQEFADEQEQAQLAVLGPIHERGLIWAKR